MKGIVLAGGTGTRLYPLTKSTNKHLLPVYDKPMVYYSINTLKSIGITDIMVVTGKEHMGHMVETLGTGYDLGVDLTYKVQDYAGGIAHALGLCEKFVGDDQFFVILGDNIFENCFDMVTPPRDTCHLLLKQVKDSWRFGVAEFDDRNRLVRIIEKPDISNGYVVTGLYHYPPDVFDFIRELVPSGRNELEITDVNNKYIRLGRCTYSIFDGFWSDAGTFDSLLNSSVAARRLNL